MKRPVFPQSRFAQYLSSIFIFEVFKKNYACCLHYIRHTVTSVRNANKLNVNRKPVCALEHFQ